MRTPKKLKNNKLELPEDYNILKGIKLLVLDINDVLTPKEDQNIPPEIREKIKEITNGERSFRIALLTGRNLDYAQKFLDIVSEDGIIMAEYGSILYYSRKKEYTVSKEMLEDIKKLKKILDPYIIKVGGQIEEKEAVLTYRPPSNKSIKDFFIELSEYFKANSAEFYDKFELTHSQSAVDIIYKGMDKGAGIRLLANKLRLDPTKIAYMGDSAGDILAFAYVAKFGGVCIAPNNATDEVKRYLQSLADAGKKVLLFNEFNSSEAVLKVLEAMHNFDA